MAIPAQIRSFRHILVVCVGDICRSPMAEALLKNALSGSPGFTVESAGLGALVGHPADIRAGVSAWVERIHA